ncbi:ABC transporter ATP-binding protein [Enterococcus sp. LJL99]
MELRIENITKKYENKPILDNISFSLTPGVYGLLGANGSGKTTLFRIMCGLMTPTSGEIKFNHQNIVDQADDYRTILGFLPQDFCYYPDFSGLKFMLYIAALKGLNKSLAKKRCHELLSLVGLSEVQNKKIRTYSGGMKQRLGIAQAMINDPEILILDEPTVGLDPKERVRFRNLISSFSTKKIVILSTHIVSDVEYIADQILILRNGVLENSGSTVELLKEIEHNVWELQIDKQHLPEILQKHIITNQKFIDDKILLRIISKEAPSKDAQLVVPTLEDLYLHYFREGTN